MKTQTLAVIDGVGVSPNHVRIRLPGWRPPCEGNTTEMIRGHLPKDVQGVLDAGLPVYMTCYANLAARSSDKLNLCDFSLAPEPVPENELA